MASIIRIKRSSTSGNPSTLGAGELAYSALTDNGSNGGDRLYIGIGTETAGNAANHVVIGGKYFTDLVSAATNLNTASAIVKRDASGNFSAGTITATLSGNASTASALQTARTIAFTGDATASGSFDGSANYSQAITLATVNSNTGTFGSSTSIPVITVNAKGLVTAVSTASISTTLNIAAGGATSGSVALGSQTLTIAGGNGITTSVSGQTLTISSIGAGGYTSTATGAGTTTLTSSSTANQFFTGSTTQTVKLPSTATLTVGQEFIITNNSTGALTIQTSAAGAIVTQPAGTQVTYNVASTSTETWVYEYTGFNALTGSGSNVLAVSPSLTTPTIGSAGANFSGSTSGTTALAASATASGTLTLPAATDTLVGKATTDTFTNKTFDTAGTGNVLKINGTQVSAVTGTGSVVLASSPTLVTPNLGTPSAVTLTNATGLPVATGISGLGTGIATFLATPSSANLIAAMTDETGTGSLVFATSPTLVTPVLGVASATSISTTAGLVSSGAFSGTYSDGVVVDYVTGNGRLSVGSGDGITLYNNTDTTRQSIFAVGSTGAVTLLGGSITGTTAITITAGGTNSNINFVPTGTGTVDHNGARLTGVGTPTQATDAANKAYVDGVKQALDIKDSVRVATTSNLAATASGTGAGKTLTNSVTQAAITIDSVPLSAGDRVLVKDQTTGADNGIYTVTTVGTASTNWVLTRATDADNSPAGEVTAGLFTFVEEGTVNADSGWVLSTNNSITLDTTALVFVQFSGAGQITAGAGLTKTGNQLDVVGTSNRITVNADSIDIASTYVGQSSITTLGTITTGTWTGGVIGATYGGTGVNNGSNTITVGGNLNTAAAFTTAGAFALTLTTTASTNVTLPTTGTLATLAGTESLSNKTITSSSFSGSVAATTLSASGAVTLTSTTDASALGTAAVVLSGGLSVAKAIYVGTNITGAGAATSTLDGFQIDGGTY